jgi:uncharacterized membrane protein YkoI
MDVDLSSMTAPQADTAGNVPTGNTAAPYSQPPSLPEPTYRGDSQSGKSSANNGGQGSAVRPYGWLLKRIRNAVPGDVIKVKLKHNSQDLWTYDVTVLSESGRYVQISLNATTGVIISKKRR